MTAPGQTAAVSLFTDPLIAASLRISRTQLSASDTGNASVSAADCATGARRRGPINYHHVRVLSAREDDSPSRIGESNFMSSELAGPEQASASRVIAEARRRRTFAVISHPDAGKSTLTEALALHAQVIAEAEQSTARPGGARPSRTGWRWSRQRGISITSTALQFAYRRPTSINLLDTPGHARLLRGHLPGAGRRRLRGDAASTRPRASSRRRSSCSRCAATAASRASRSSTSGTGPGRTPLELIDEIEQPIGLQPDPGDLAGRIAGDFRGVVDRRTGRFIRFTRTAGGATDRARGARRRRAWPRRGGRRLGAGGRGAASCSSATAPTYDHETFLAGRVDAGVLRLRRSPTSASASCSTPSSTSPRRRRPDRRRRRSRARSTRRSRGVRLQGPGQHGPAAPRPPRLRPGLLGSLRARHGRHPRPHRQAVRHQVRAVGLRSASATPSTTAFPGDVIGLVNATALRVGDTLYATIPYVSRRSRSSPPSTSPSPAVADTEQHKQFRTGIAQLDEEGVVQVLRSDLRGDQAPVLAAVGPDAVRSHQSPHGQRTAHPDHARTPQLQRRAAHPSRRYGLSRRSIGRGSAHPLRRSAAGAVQRQMADGNHSAQPPANLCSTRSSPPARNGQGSLSPHEATKRACTGQTDATSLRSDHRE